jgi:hypothetical protein
VLAVSLAAAVADACEVPAGFTPLGRADADGVLVVFRTIPAPIELGRHFSVDTVVCADAGPAELRRIDATMPEHRHGMNYRPTLARKDHARYVADGFLFHMPGRWQLLFDVVRGERTTRLTADLVVE